MPIEIPIQLRTKEFRFCLIRKGKKRAIEKRWVDGLHSFDSPKLLNWLKKGENYGVCTGFGDLVVIDFDDSFFQNKIRAVLPESFAVMTGSGKLHLYFICKGFQSFKISKDKRTLADVQSFGKQVVAPGSIHPNGTRYTVFDPVDIACLSKERLLSVLSPFMKKTVKKSVLKIPRRKRVKVSNILEVAKKLGMRIDNAYKTCCPFHNDTNPSLQFYPDENKFYCFGCGIAGSANRLVHLVNEKSGLFKNNP